MSGSWQDGPQDRVEGKSRPFVYLHLIYPGYGVLHRVFYSRYVDLVGVKVLDDGIKSRRFSASRGPRDQYDAVRNFYDFIQGSPSSGSSPSLSNSNHGGGLIEQAHDQLFAVNGGQTRDPYVYASAGHAKEYPAVLGVALSAMSMPDIIFIRDDTGG